MPYFYYSIDYPERVKERKRKERIRKKKHDDIVRRWRSGELTWNEYCRLEKRFR